MPVDFTIARDALHPVVDRVHRRVAKKNTIPILGNIRISAARDGSVDVTATDLDIVAIARTTPATARVETIGETTVPAALLHDFLRHARGDVRFTDKGEGRAKVRAGRATATLFSLPVEDFPDMAGAAMPHETALPRDALTAIDETVAFAISREETRYYLNGAYLHAEDGQLAFVATDGHRLSRLVLDVPAPASMDYGIIIPRETVEAFPSIAKAAEHDVAMRFGENRIAFDTQSGFQLESKLIDGTFPDYRRVVPANNPCRMLFDREAMIAAIDRVSIAASEKGQAVKLRFGKNEIGLSVNSAEHGETEDAIDMTGEGLDNPIGFNGRYLRELLSSFTGPRMEMALADPGTAALITDPETPNRLTVLMPMRV